MLNVPRHLVVDIPTEEAQSLLSQWRWFVGEEKRVFLVSASGDLFLTDHGGKVFWLETGSGRLDRRTGLGLALVRKVVERMGGQAGVESEEGHGSRFRVELGPAEAVGS